MYGVVVNSFFSGPFTSSSRVQRSDPNIFYPESALILSGVPPMEISIRTVLSSIRIWILKVLLGVLVESDAGCFPVYLRHLESLYK